MKLRRLMMLATAIAAGSSSVLATDLHFDYTPQANAGTPGADPHFGLAQLAVLNYPSIDGNYMMVTGTLTASQIQQAGNTSVIWYDTFNHNEYPAYSAADETAKIDSYAKSKNGNVRPGWVVLNELSSLMRDTTSNGDSYRQWTVDVMSMLHNTYNYNIVLLNQKGTLSSSSDGPYQSTWQSLASNAYIGIEEYLGGPSIINAGSDYTARFNFAKNAYQNSKNSYINVGGIGADRLMLIEHFGNTSSDPSIYYGRHGLLPASDWDTAIQVRQDAIYSVGFAGFLAYAWGGNGMGITETEQIQHEYYYRTRLVLPGQQPQWLPDNTYTIGDAATPVPLSWNQPLNWLGSGVVNGVPNSVPDSPGAVANFFRTNSAARTITLDGNKTIGTLSFDSPNSYTISAGSGGSILLNNSGNAAIVLVSQGSHSITVPVQLQNNVNATVANISAVLSVSGAISGANAITKAGSGTLVLSGANSYLGGTMISAGTLLITNTSGSATGSGAMTVNSGATLGGNGTISGAVSNSGTVAPGTSAGTMNLGGSYTQTSAGSLAIELASATSYDKLAVTGAATLAGALNVSLTGGFMPHEGDAYQILTASSLGGTTFSSISFPALSGNLAWNIRYGAATVTLSIVLPGDFNGDGTVDAADYVVWRKGLGTTYTQSDYDVWRAHFGQTAGSGAGVSANAVVPEPATLAILIMAASGWCLRRRRAA